MIEEKQLRHLKVLGFDAEKQISVIDLAGSANTVIDSVDLDGDAKLRSKVLSGLVRNPDFLNGILNEMITRLGHASIALNQAPVKGLIIADGVEHADQVYAALQAIWGTRNVFLAHGQSAGAEAAIQQFRLSPNQAALVAVQKVTEGFDVPDICVLTYLRTWKAPLFINQMVGRAMRISAREREVGQAPAGNDFDSE